MFGDKITIKNVHVDVKLSCMTRTDEAVLDLYAAGWDIYNDSISISQYTVTSEP